MELDRPFFVDGTSRRVGMQVNFELVMVCKLLRAFTSGAFSPRSPNFNADFDHLTDADISGPECFEILLKQCRKTHEQIPVSFLVMANFVKFLEPQFTKMCQYEILNLAAMGIIEGLENFKHVFADLLIRTSADFSLPSVTDRSVQDEVAAPLQRQRSRVTTDEMQRAGSGDGLVRAGSGGSGPSRAGSGGALTRGTSLELPDVAAVTVNPQNELTGEGRVASAGYVDRFSSMISWENSDHVRAACVRACVCACVRACGVRACVRACVILQAWVRTRVFACWLDLVPF
jgi:hypothetical protein